MRPRRVFALALGTQCLLIVGAWAASRALHLTPAWGEPVRDTVIGLAAALVLAGGNFILLRHAPGNWLVNGVRTVYHDVLVPLFAGLGGVGIIVLGAAAGIGEEWLFRGALQPSLGLVATSLVFGLAHVGGWKMLPFGVWASIMGLILGGLAITTGGLIAPIVAHGVYDMMALEYIRRGAHNE